MRALTRFEIRACALALLVHGLVTPLVPQPAEVRPVPSASASTAGAREDTGSRVAPLPPVPAVVTGVEGAPPIARTVALTFDDGPDPRWTPQVLDLLARHHAVATFCLVGENATRHPELVRAIVDAGMQLCDHSHRHEIDPSRPGAGMAHDDLATLAGTDVPWFRAPGGVWSAAVQRAAADHGMRPLGWNVDSRDWTRPGVAAIVERVQQQVRPGAVALLHDGGGRRDQTVAALEELLPWLAARCYATTFPDGR
jgi:peptidoglycan/xylan/chitin deacetylase (PgdA/CDA1 family)